MSQKRNAGTAYGDVEYETVTCCSCGNEAVKETTEFVVRGEVVEYHDWTRKKEYQFDSSNMETGYLCEVCQEGEPANYPQGDSFWKRLKFAFEVL